MTNNFNDELSKQIRNAISNIKPSFPVFNYSLECTKMADSLQNQIKQLSDTISKQKIEMNNSFQKLAESIKIDYSWIETINSISEIIPPSFFKLDFNLKSETYDDVRKYSNLGICYTGIENIDFINKKFNKQTDIDNYIDNIPEEKILEMLDKIIELYPNIPENEFIKNVLDEGKILVSQEKYNLICSTLLINIEPMIIELYDLLTPYVKFTPTDNKTSNKISDANKHINKWHKDWKNNIDNNDADMLTYPQFLKLESIFIISKKFFKNTDKMDKNVPNRHESAHGLRENKYNKNHLVKIMLLMLSILNF